MDDVVTHEQDSVLSVVGVRVECVHGPMCMWGAAAMWAYLGRAVHLDIQSGASFVFEPCFRIGAR
eukprot:2381920-Alexandrium_andersonii.AAC.1